MPIPTVYAVGTVNANTGALMTVGIPAGTDADDVLLLLHEDDPVLSPAALGAITGYSEVLNSPVSQTGGLPTRLVARWHRATGPESGTITVPAVTNHHLARIIGIRGCVTSGNPWNVTASGLQNSAVATVTFPTLTTTVADCLIVNAVTTGHDINTTTHIGSWVNAGLAAPAITEHVDNWTASGTGGGIGAAAGGKAAAGAVSASTATVNNANVQAMITIAFQGGAAPLPRAEYRTAQLNVYRM
jgi:hypothetical protein